MHFRGINNMSDPIQRIMQRMSEIRSRIDEIRNLGNKINAHVSQSAGIKDGVSGSSAAESPEATSEFSLLLREAVGLLESQSEENGISLSNSMLGPLLGVSQEEILAGLGGNGSKSPEELLNQSGTADDSDKITESFLLNALEAYKKQNQQ